MELVGPATGTAEIGALKIATGQVSLSSTSMSGQSADGGSPLEHHNTGAITLRQDEGGFVTLTHQSDKAEGRSDYEAVSGVVERESDPGSAETAGVAASFVTDEETAEANPNTTGHATLARVALEASESVHEVGASAAQSAKAQTPSKKSRKSKKDSSKSPQSPKASSAKCKQQ